MIYTYIKSLLYTLYNISIKLEKIKWKSLSTPHKLTPPLLPNLMTMPTWEGGRKMGFGVIQTGQILTLALASWITFFFFALFLIIWHHWDPALWESDMMRLGQSQAGEGRLTSPPRSVLNPEAAVQAGGEMLRRRAALSPGAWGLPWALFLQLPWGHTSLSLLFYVQNAPRASQSLPRELTETGSAAGCAWHPQWTALRG